MQNLESFKILGSVDFEPAAFDRYGSNRVSRTDFHHYLPLDILTKVDRMSMAHSIETRVPLLDHVFVEVAAKIPSKLKLRNGRTKHIFKEAMRGILPNAILDRRKQGFAIPLDRWFRNGLGSYVRELLLSPQAVQRGIFEPEFLRKLIAHNERGRPLGSELWTLISFELWCRTFLDRDLSARTSKDSNDRLGASVHEAAL